MLRCRLAAAAAQSDIYICPSLTALIFLHLKTHAVDPGSCHGLFGLP